MITIHRTLVYLSLTCIATATVPLACPQTLARPGWVGSGITTDLWWKRAVIYEVNPADFNPTAGSGIHGVTTRLDYIHSLGADAVLLTPLQLDPTHAQEIAPNLGTNDDFDDLLREASSRHLRVLLDLDPAIPSVDLPNVARFWLNRGVAGFHVSGTNETARAQAASLRTANASYLGQRILIADADPKLAPTSQSQPEPQPASRGRHHAHARSQRKSTDGTAAPAFTSLDTQSPQLLLDNSLAATTTLNAAVIRPIIEHLQDIQQTGYSLPLLATDGPTFPRSMSRYTDGQHDLAIAKLLATLLFTRSESLLYYGQELGVRAPAASPLILWDAPPPSGKSNTPPATSNSDTTPNAALEDADPNSLLNWYRRLSALHHGNATLASGTSLTINRDDQNVLVLIRKPKVVSAGSPVLVLLFNFTAQPVHLSLKADVAKLGLRGSFLRTVLRSDEGMGTLHLDEMTLPSHCAYIGELRY
jgi:Alpha amylase, catalytic domain